MFKGLTSHKSKELHGSCQGKSPHSSRAEMFCAVLSVAWILEICILFWFFFHTSHTVLSSPYYNSLILRRKTKRNYTSVKSQDSHSVPNTTSFKITILMPIGKLI